MDTVALSLSKHQGEEVLRLYEKPRKKASQGSEEKQATEFGNSYDGIRLSRQFTTE